MDELTLVNFDNPVLYQPTVEFDFNAPPVNPQELFEQMKAALVKAGGLGLSANQVGLPYNMCVVGNSKDPENIVAHFNVRIVDFAQEEKLLLEGCLSVPGLYLQISRPVGARVRSTNVSGQTNTAVFSGLTARIILHEMDHLQGKPFFNAASKLRLERAIKAAKKQYNVTYNFTELYRLIKD